MNRIDNSTTEEFVNPYLMTGPTTIPFKKAVMSLQDELREEKHQLLRIGEPGLAAKVEFVICQIDTYDEDLDIPECLENYITILQNQIVDAFMLYASREINRLNQA